MRVYATPDDYTDWLKPDPAPEPDEAERQLRNASIRVDEMLRGCVYDVDEEGMPTVQRIKETIRDATCAQAAYTDDTGDEHGTGGFEEVQARSVRLRKAANAQSGNSGPASAYSPVAAAILRNEGLTPQIVVVQS